MPPTVRELTVFSAAGERATCPFRPSMPWLEAFSDGYKCTKKLCQSLYKEKKLIIFCAAKAPRSLEDIGPKRK